MRAAIFLVLCFLIHSDLIAQFPAPYCAANFSGGVRPITRVSLNTINNISALSPDGGPHQDFTSQSTHLLSSTPYWITVSGNTAGSNLDYYQAYFDWNHDNDFTDPGEAYYIGTIINSTGADGITASNRFKVPSTALEGSTRMRVIKAHDFGPSSCNAGGFGQAEDYTVIISHPPPMAVYVNTLATGANNGTSWNDAYTSLRAAIDSSRARDTIKVAAGTYKPGGTRGEYFSLLEGSVLLGGYPASGNPTDANRHPGLHPTILNGDIGTMGYGEDNIVHVVRFQQVSDSTVLDGFIIENGYAGYSTILNQMQGGGMFLEQASPLIRNCVFRNNYAYQDGAALVSTGGSPSFSNCFFVYHENENSTSTILLQSGSQPVFTNCVFARNRGTTIHAESSQVQLRHCNFVNNRLLNYYHGARNHSIFAENNSTLSVANSIFYNNISYVSSDSTDIRLISSTASVTKTITQVFATGETGLQNAQPKFRDSSRIAGQDNLFFTPDDGLQLVNPCSPAIHAGLALNPAVSQDILGLPRIFGSQPDLGAYEVQSALLPVPKVLFVNKAATGSNDGTSWANAFTDLNSALNACSDTIKVAAGTYYPSSSDYLASYWLENKRVLLGGYPNSGNPSELSRNPTANPTIISASLPSSGGVRSLVLMRGRWLDSTAVVDGFTLQETLAIPLPGVSYNYAGAVYLTYSSSPIFRNCTLKNNIGNPGGALVTHFSSSPSFINCLFEGNTYSGTGGSPIGSAVANFSESAPKFFKCIFRNNSTFQGSIIGYWGGAMRNVNASPIIDSCIFMNNASRDYGGAIANLNNSNPIITNSFFQGNRAPSHGNDIYNHGSSPQVSHCVFYGNLNSNNGGAVANLDNSNPIFEHCLFQNCKSEFNGGAVFNDFSAPVFKRCVFANNLALSSGGAVYSTNYSRPQFTNCLAVNNTAGRGSVLYNRKSVVSVLHCTFSNNNLLGNAHDHGGVVYNVDSNHTTIRNSILTENELMPSQDYSGDILNFSGNFPTVTELSHSLVQVSGTQGVNGNLVGVNARQVNNIDPDGPDNLFFTADDGAALSPCSPAVNAGNNIFSMNVTKDIIDSTRLYGGTVDMGAYEFGGTPYGMRSFFVKAGATGNNTGLNWQDAYTNLQTAFCNPCADTVKVAAGIYKPAASQRDSSFFINIPLTVYGGYPASGDPGDGDRDPFTHSTILSGNIGNVNDSLDNSYTVLVLHEVRDTILLDGLVIRDGHGGGGGITINAAGGGGLYTYGNHTILRNTQFIKNRANPFGGALSIGFYTTADISHCIFDGNSSTNYGGALIYRGTNLKLSNSVFLNNYSFGQGGAIKTEGGVFDISNSIFYKNFTTANNQNGNGGAVHAQAGSGNIYNCNFLENRTTYNSVGAGGGLYSNQSLGTFVRNCIFSGNKVGSSTTTNGADFDWNGNYNVVNRCLLQTTRSFAQDNKYGVEPGFINEANPAGPDGKWFTADDGLQLNYSSPAIDYGLNSAVNNTPKDILELPRIVSNTVDAGAYEYQNKAVAGAGKDTTICVGGTAQIGVGGNPNHSYSWTSIPAGFSSSAAQVMVQPTENTSYILEVSNGSETSRDTVTVNISNSLVPSVQIISSSTNICQGSTVSFTAQPVHEGATPNYQWKVDGISAGSNSAVFTTNSLTNGAVVSLVMNSSASCASVSSANSNSITMTVQPTVTPSVTISQSPGTLCTGTQATFTATPVNGGNAPQYQWQVNGTSVGSNSSNYIVNSTGLLSGTQVTVIMTSSACAAPVSVTSNAITVQVNQQVAPSVSISASAVSICSGTNVVFTASAVNAGSTPVYEWRKNGVVVGTNSNTFSSTSLAHGDMIQLAMTSSLACASPASVSANNITMTVTPSVFPSVVINGVTNLVLGATSPITTSINEGGSNPSYQWQDSTATHGWQTIPGAVSSSLNYTPAASGDRVRCLLTSNAACASPATVNSNVLIFTVTPTAISPVAGAAWGIRYYPNPAVTELVIDSLKMADHWQELMIVSIDGRQQYSVWNIRQQQQVRVQVSALPAGIYLAILRREDGRMVYLPWVKK